MISSGKLYRALRDRYPISFRLTTCKLGGCLRSARSLLKQNTVKRKNFVSTNFYIKIIWSKLRLVSSTEPVQQILETRMVKKNLNGGELNG